MSKHNLNGKFSSLTDFKTWSREEMMAHYDSLPKAYRDVVKDTFAPATIFIESTMREPEFYRQHFLKIQKESTRKTYGADHPQAA